MIYAKELSDYRADYQQYDLNKPLQLTEGRE